MYLPECLRLRVAEYLWLCPRPGYAADTVRHYKAFVIQRWVRTRYRGRCADCGRKTTALRQVPACGRFQVTSRLCCSKYVCCEGCQVRCAGGHRVFVEDDDGWRYNRACPSCEYSVFPSFEWYGVDLQEARAGRSGSSVPSPSRSPPPLHVLRRRTLNGGGGWRQ